jgi:hypothetical protein
LLLLMTGVGGPYLEAMASPLKSHGSLRLLFVWLWGERMMLEIYGFGRNGGVSVGVCIQVERGFDIVVDGEVEDSADVDVDDDSGDQGR